MLDGRWPEHRDTDHHRRRHASERLSLRGDPGRDLLRTRGKGRVDLFVNHETCSVPFPFNAAVADSGQGENDFDNSQVSRLTLTSTAGVLNGSFVIAQQRRTTSGSARTSSRPARRASTATILFTNEESPGLRLRQDGFVAAAAPPTPARSRPASSSRYDVKTGQHRPIYGMGRHNHENNVAIPGYGDPSCSRVTTRSSAVRSRPLRRPNLA